MSTPATETVEITGHLMDSGILSLVLNDIRDYGGDHVVEKFELGHDTTDTSYARILVTAEDEDSLQRMLMRLQTRGVNMVDPGEVTVTAADIDGVFPDGFYSTTNLETRVRYEGKWLQVGNPEMDCGLIIEGSGEASRVYTLPMSDVKVGMLVVCGASGVKVSTPTPVGGTQEEVFGFMESDVSSEKPQALLVRQVADGMRDAKAAGKRVLWVGGPGVVHTGAAPAMVAIVNAGFVDVLFAGNALATHDVESVALRHVAGRRPGPGSWCRARPRAPHSRAQHDPQGGFDRGCGRAGCADRRHHARDGDPGQGLRAGRVGARRRPASRRLHRRDRGSASDARRDRDVGFCLMVATMLHSVATGNILPASIPLVCVDINPATVTKLADRGSSQARGIVTDVGLFLEQLAQELVPEYTRPR